MSLEELYKKFPKKIIDRVIEKFNRINQISNEDYFYRLESILKMKMENPYSSGKEYLKLFYGESFDKYWEDKNKDLITPYKIQYWKNKGFSQIDSEKKIKEYKSKKATTSENFIAKYGKKEGKKRFDEFKNKSKQTKEKFQKKHGKNWMIEWENYIKSKDSTSFEWALKKSMGDIEQAKTLYEKRLNSILIDKEKKIEELGSYENYLVYIKELNKSKGRTFEDSLKKNNGNYLKAVNEYTEILKKRRVRFGSASKISLNFFYPIYDFLKSNTEYKCFLEIEESSPFFLYDNVNKRSYCYDFCIMSQQTKLIIEFNGIKWHPRLEKYTLQEYKQISAYLKDDIKINEKYYYDLEKKRVALDNGFSYLIIWDEDNPQLNIENIEFFLHKNKIKFTYDEDTKNKISQKAKPRKINLGLGSSGSE